MSKWKIDKQFSFDYGHRVWSQELNSDFTENGDTKTPCRHPHGHLGTVHVFLEGETLERGMVTDFKHLGWLKTFLDDSVDHKFILDVNDPIFTKLLDLHRTIPTQGVPNGLSYRDDGTFFVSVKCEDDPSKVFCTLDLVPVVVPGTKFCAGWVFAQRPNAAEAVAAEKMVWAELHDPRRDHVEKFLNFCILKRRRL